MLDLPDIIPITDLRTRKEPQPGGGYTTTVLYRVGESRRSSRYGEWITDEEAMRRTKLAVGRAWRG